METNLLLTSPAVGRIIKTVRGTKGPTQRRTKGVQKEGHNGREEEHHPRTGPHQRHRLCQRQRGQGHRRGSGQHAGAGYQAPQGCGEQGSSDQREPCQEGGRAGWRWGHDEGRCGSGSARDCYHSEGCGGAACGLRAGQVWEGDGQEEGHLQEGGCRVGTGPEQVGKRLKTKLFYVPHPCACQWPHGWVDFENKKS